MLSYLCNVLLTRHNSTYKILGECYGRNNRRYGIVYCICYGLFKCRNIPQSDWLWLHNIIIEKELAKKEVMKKWLY